MAVQTGMKSPTSAAPTAPTAPSTRNEPAQGQDGETLWKLQPTWSNRVAAYILLSRRSEPRQVFVDSTGGTTRSPHYPGIHQDNRVSVDALILTILPCRPVKRDGIRSSSH